MIYHETVHWGDIKSDATASDRRGQRPDWGSKWELDRDVYGKILSTDAIAPWRGLVIDKGEVLAWQPMKAEPIRKYP